MQDGYPRIYRRRGKSRGAAAFFGFVLLFIGSLVAVSALAALLEDSESGAAVFFSMLVLAGGAYLLLAAFRPRVVLRPDRIEVRGILRTRVRRVAELEGRRRAEGGAGPEFVVLVPRNPELARLRLPRGIESDPVLSAWVEALPDLDARDRRDSLERILEDPGSGDTRLQRFAQLTRARRETGWLVGVAAAVGLWVAFVSNPNDAVMLAAVLIPWIAVLFAARPGGIYRIEPSRNDAGADVTLALLIPSFTLAVRGLLDGHRLDTDRMLLMAVAGIVASVVIILWRVPDQRRPARKIFLLVVYTGLYWYGTLAYINQGFDDSRPENFTTTVIDKRVSTGRSTSWYVQLAPWGPQDRQEEISVSEEFYAAAKVGAKTCVHLWRGAVGLRRYEVWDCKSE